MPRNPPPPQRLRHHPARNLSTSSHTRQGFFPHRGITKRIHFSRGFPFPASFRPQAFSASRRFAPRLAPRAYSIPQPRLGFPVWGFSPRTAVLSRQENPAPLPLRRNRYRLPSATISPLDFEALLRAEMRSSGSGVSRTFGRSPLQFPLPGFHPSRREPSYLSHPPFAFLKLVFTFALTSSVRLRRFVSEKIGLSVSRPPASLKF